MKKTAIILIYLLASLTVNATIGRVAEINAIKKDALYIYGEATMPTKEEASSLAYELLQKRVLEWAQEDSLHLNITSVADINQMADTIITRRADMFRVFAYIRKSCLTQDAPIDSSAVNAHLPKQDSLLTDSVKRVIRHRFFGRKENDALLRLKEARSFFELKDIMQPLKAQGDIIDYGKYATAERPEECYLIVYDPAGNIRALLGKGTDVRANLKTGRDDSIHNYRGCGALWFKLKE